MAIPNSTKFCLVLLGLGYEYRIRSGDQSCAGILASELAPGVCHIRVRHHPFPLATEVMKGLLQLVFFLNGDAFPNVSGEIVR